jgi:hypothetical protein
MSTRPFSEIKPLPSIETLAAALKASGQAGKDAGLNLAQEAASFGLTVKDYIVLAGHEQNDRTKDGMNAYEKLLAALNLPLRNDYENGVYLQAASETFSTYPGTRALFPQVIDDVLRWANRQDLIETVAPLVSNSRTINGAEMLSTVVDDDSAERDTFLVAEGARIPVRTIKTSEKTVRIYKHGSGIRTTYEFNRRASIDLLIPYANRIARELEISKVKAATYILINGDGVYSAAPEVDQSSYNTVTGVTATNGKISWPHFLSWVVARAQAGVPIDTVVMNWDGFIQWMLMFGTTQANAGPTAAESLAKAGVSVNQMPASLKAIMQITPVISSTMTANKMLGFIKGETLEELVEAGSNIQETERAISNQTVTVYRTENTGYRLVWGDTRSVYDFGA